MNALISKLERSMWMKQPELASKFGIMSIPTLVVMKNGKIVTKVSGARPKKAILEML